MTLEEINRLRKRLHLHSIIYYHMNTSVITDAQFDKWANELVEANKNHPEFIHVGYRPSLFADWTGDTGMHLPYTDEMGALAEWVIEENSKRLGQDV